MFHFGFIRTVTYIYIHRCIHSTAVPECVVPLPPLTGCPSRKTPEWCATLFFITCRIPTKWSRDPQEHKLTCALFSFSILYLLCFAWLLSVLLRLWFLLSSFVSLSLSLCPPSYTNTHTYPYTLTQTNMRHIGLESSIFAFAVHHPPFSH